MPRWLLVLGGAIAVWAWGAPLLLAADGSGWPPYTGPMPVTRGPGGYFSVWKIALLWILVLALIS